MRKLTIGDNSDIDQDRYIQSGPDLATIAILGNMTILILVLMVLA